MDVCFLVVLPTFFHCPYYTTHSYPLTSTFFAIFQKHESYPQFGGKLNRAGLGESARYSDLLEGPPLLSKDEKVVKCSVILRGELQRQPDTKDENVYYKGYDKESCPKVRTGLENWRPAGLDDCCTFFCCVFLHEMTIA